MRTGGHCFLRTNTKQRFKNRKDEQEQRKHFMDHKDSNRYRFKSSRVAWDATE